MRIHDLTPADLTRRLSDPGLTFRTGPFVVRLQSSLRHMAKTVRLLWPDYPIADENAFTDFDIVLDTPCNSRRWFRPQVQFVVHGHSPFLPLPLDQAFPMFEWGLNWCIASHAHQFLITHAATVERGGYAAILPGTPGTGKSTLCAALVNRGWRLLTDEITLVSRKTGLIIPLARPVSLKNESIEVIRQFAPGAILGPPVRDTVKGTVAHMRAPADSVLRADEPAVARWVIFPEYRPGNSTEIRPLTKAKTFMWFAGHSYNYTLLGMKGFDLLSDLVDNTRPYIFSYSSLNEAIAWFETLRPRPCDESDTQALASLADQREFHAGV